MLLYPMIFKPRMAFVKIFKPQHFQLIRPLNSRGLRHLIGVQGANFFACSLFLATCSTSIMLWLRETLLRPFFIRTPPNPPFLLIYIPQWFPRAAAMSRVFCYHCHLCKWAWLLNTSPIHLALFRRKKIWCVVRDSTEKWSQRGWYFSPTLGAQVLLVHRRA